MRVTRRRERIPGESTAHQARPSTGPSTTLPDSERIVVTGAGMVSPYGVGVDRFLEAIRRGEAAIRPIEEFDVSDCLCRLGARIPKIDFTAFDASSGFRRAPRATQYTIVAADEALRGAGQSPPTWSPERVGVFLATYRGMTEVSEQIWTKLIEGSPRFVPPLLFQETVTNAVASAISIRWGLRGTDYAVSSGNASGYQVLYLAAQALKAGRADAILAGAFDIFTATNHHDMDDLGMLSASNASRPFDCRRDGFIMGEGAGVLVLETLAGARARGANVLCEIAGVGVSHDAFGFGTHHPEGRGLALAMRYALAEAGRTARDVDYIGAAGNSTPALDRAESLAIHDVFGSSARRVPVSSLKALTGEAMAASDMFNLIAAIAAIRDGALPSQVGSDQPDPGCDLNLVRGQNDIRPVRTVLAHSYSYFGGSAAAAVVQESVA